MTETNTTALAPFYYRANYMRLCDTVEAQYADILSTAERTLLQRFRDLEFAAQCLYVRLICRAGPWFRESKLAYSELGPVGPLLDVLLAQGMATPAVALSTQDLGKLFTRRDLQQIFPSLDPRQAHDKAALLRSIDQLQLSAGETMRTLAAVEPQRIVSPCGVELAQLLQLLFFGNRRQSLTDFVLQDLGVTRYYPYELNREHRLFSCREAVEEYLACAAIRDSHQALLDTGNLDQLPALAAQVLGMTIRFPSSTRSWHRLCNRLAWDLERMDQRDSALQLYRCSRRHPARERSARILENRGAWAAAAALCEEIISQPWCEAEHEAAERILPRVRRQIDGSRLPRRRDAFNSVSLTLPPGSGAVELQVASHLESQWNAVYYVENKLMNALFGLAFWEQIFAPVPGVFHNPYQSAPADMYDSAFSAARRELVATRLAQLREADPAESLLAAYQHYRDYQCRWVDWRYIDADLIDASTRAIPAAHLLAIWERILFDPGENRRGFPDLIALGAAPGDYCLIEVKGPGDALQDSQKRWLRFFHAQQIPAQVAWVEWRDD